MLSTDSILHDRYRIVHPLKTGSMGAVYLAFDLRLGARVAVKELQLAVNISDKNLHTIKTAFAAEAALLANLNHPAIPRAHDFFEQNETQYLVMELIEGSDLAEFLQRRSGHLLDASMVLDWADQMLAALEYLHAQQTPVIHRDIKPANVKVTPSGQVKLLDFGIAKGVLGEMRHSSCEASLRMATLEYAPPEQAIKACPEWRSLLANLDPLKTEEILACKTDARTDLFALAATVYRLLTAQLPADSLARAFAIWSGKPDPLVPIRALRADIAPEISAVLMQALALAPANRPASATQMRRDLQTLRSQFADKTADGDGEQLAARVKQLERRLRDEMQYRRQVEAKWLNAEAVAAQQKQEIERAHQRSEAAIERLIAAEAARLAAETNAARFKKMIVQFLSDVKNSLSDSPRAVLSDVFAQAPFAPGSTNDLFALNSLVEVRDRHGKLLIGNESSSSGGDFRVIG